MRQKIFGALIIFTVLLQSISTVLEDKTFYIVTALLILFVLAVVLIYYIFFKPNQETRTNNGVSRST